MPPTLEEDMFHINAKSAERYKTENFGDKSVQNRGEFYGNRI